MPDREPRLLAPAPVLTGRFHCGGSDHAVRVGRGALDDVEDVQDAATGRKLEVLPVVSVVGCRLVPTSPVLQVIALASRNPTGQILLDRLLTLCSNACQTVTSKP
ncbi:hypothetical protein GCM10010321_87420 [Streptomyces chartreusis]|nr:hypothetical protein GCM10010321_87420 [Streptomyces chartreusis]